MRALSSAALLLLVGLLAGGAPAAAQQRPIEGFVQQVAQLWQAGDAAGVAALAPRGGMVLDTGGGTQTVNSRHAAAALRALFAQRESVATRPARVTLAGGSPPRGFGELAWSFRTRGASSPQTRSVYVGAVWENDGWRVGELRVMP
jgi:hypothetical protein